MGYYIFSFGIKENQVLKTFGSKNQEIIKKVEKNELFESYNNQDDGGFTTKNALLDIVNGEKLHEKYAHIYGYALISLCATFGDKLPYEQEMKFGYETNYINKYLENDFEIKDFDIEEFLFSNGSLKSFPIPKIEDFPILSVLKLKKLKELKSKLLNVIISNDEIEELKNNDESEDVEEKGCTYEHIKGFIDNVDFCIKNELDLFSACH